MDILSLWVTCAHERTAYHTAPVQPLFGSRRPAGPPLLPRLSWFLLFAYLLIEHISCPGTGHTSHSFDANIYVRSFSPTLDWPVLTINRIRITSARSTLGPSHPHVHSPPISPCTRDLIPIRLDTIASTDSAHLTTPAIHLDYDQH